MALYIFPRGVITVANQCDNFSLLKEISNLYKYLERAMQHTHFQKGRRVPPPKKISENRNQKIKQLDFYLNHTSVLLPK